MSRVKRLWRGFVVSFINSFLCGTHFFAVKRSLLCSSGIYVGKGTKVVGPFSIGNASNISIGEDCWIGTYFSIHGNGTVCIGNKCDFGPEVSILTGSHEIGTSERRAGNGIAYTVHIGNGCWVGARATLLGNIKVDDSSVIASCALVNKNVSPNVIVAGIPAKLVKVLE